MFQEQFNSINSDRFTSAFQLSYREFDPHEYGLMLRAWKEFVNALP